MECVRYDSEFGSDETEVPNMMRSSRSSPSTAVLVLEFGSLTAAAAARETREISTEDFGPTIFSPANSAGETAADVDVFCWYVEGILILIVGCVGILGNSFSLYLMSRPRTQKIFHNLLITLAVFDTASHT